jgi:predicted Fe-Mo cluster-binding NifX family protein
MAITTNGARIMRIAVSAEGDGGLESRVSHHFGRCPYFVLAAVEDGRVVEVDVVENPHYRDHRPGQVPGFIRDQGANIVICGGMGRRAIQHFEELQVDAATGATGTAGAAIEQYLGGQLGGATPCRESVEHARHHRGARG